MRDQSENLINHFVFVPFLEIYLVSLKKRIWAIQLLLLLFILITRTSLGIMQADYGRIYLSQIDDAKTLWRLIDSLKDDGCGFVHNIPELIEAYKYNKLYGLRVDDTDAMIERGARKDPIFVPGSLYLLPCFVVLDKEIDFSVKEPHTAYMIWVHKNWRRLGLGTQMVRQANVRKAHEPLEESMDFWNDVLRDSDDEDSE
jgi:ribosomal protein S18 acetylase RimI-like enzyme